MQEVLQKPMAPIEHSQVLHPSIKAPILRFSPRQSSGKLEGTVTKNP